MKREDADYISSELTHFAGRGKTSDDERYELLVEQILKSGLLKSPWVDEHPNARCSVSKDQFRRLSANEVVEVPAICFCDIPRGMLGKHMAKYSRFGLSFKKTFMITKGAYPVFYVADRAKISEPILAIKDARISEVFDFMFSEFQQIDDSVHALVQSKILRELPDGQNTALFHQRFLKLKLFFQLYVFGYMKFFDHRLADEHADNYYFEREWRLLSELKFEAGDVETVIMPREFHDRFLADIGDTSLVNLRGRLVAAEEQ